MNYLYLVSPEYLESMEELYRTQPESLPLTWRFFFDGVEAGRGQTETPTLINGHDKVYDKKSESWDFEVRAIQLIEAYRRFGHFLAQLDPLKRDRIRPKFSLDPKTYGLDQVPPGHRFEAARLLGREPLNLDSLIQVLKALYCGTVGVEFHHVSDETERQWLHSAFEKTKVFSTGEKKNLLERLVHAAQLEAFIHRAFTGQKRFSIEGGDSLIPGMDRVVETGAKRGVQEVIIGMAHRGRLNMLVNVLRKPYEKLFTEFEGNYSYEGQEGGGDVKYHLGYSKDIEVGGKSVHLSLCYNPSHLETVNAVATGIARAKQDSKYDGDRKSVLPVLIHGDAAIVGQGVVVETYNLMSLDGYSVGGTLHIVINNQIGFTTNPEDARSGYYCTDFAKGIDSPVIHVNGEDPEAVLRCLELATEYRQQFAKDIFVDIYCYRKYGHNEGDEPRFTQPPMYNLLANFKSPAEHYLKTLETSGITVEAYQEMVKSYVATLETALQKVKGKPQVVPLDWFKGTSWKGYRGASEADLVAPCETGIPSAVFDRVIETIHSFPAGVTPLPKLQKMIEGRWTEFKKSQKADWAIGEQLAYGSLLTQGFSVRLSGQDAQRGTFSHRHAFSVDSTTGEAKASLTSLATDGQRFEVHNSPLSEYAVMGFDLGYSWAAPKTLTLWEGQFGDFSNGAQIIIDQYLAASENKWHRVTGLVLLLPHGFEGQGPEHSSARLERFLQLCALGNIQVVYPTTPAQIFHVLRRQMVRPFRKPLVVMTPKSPLRMPEVQSYRDDFLKGSFENILVTGAAPGQAKRVLLCSGKVYWDLVKTATQLKQENETAFFRLEQLYPLDKNRLLDLHKQFGNADWIWVQEEPKNNGAWSHVKLAFLDLDLPLRFVGRMESPSVATGSARIHQIEQERLLNEAFKTK